MQQRMFPVAAVLGLILGLLFGAGFATARSDSETALIEDPSLWTLFDGEYFSVDIPEDYVADTVDVDNGVGYETTFSAPKAALIVEVAQTDTNLATVAERFAEQVTGQSFDVRQDQKSVQAVSWSTASASSLRYYYREGHDAIAITSVGPKNTSVSAHQEVLDKMVQSLVVTTPQPAAPEPTTPPEPEPTSIPPRPEPTATPEPTPIPTATPLPKALPEGCIGTDRVRMRITKVEDFANARPEPNSESVVTDRLPKGSGVTWTGETHKQNKFNWHEIVPDGINECMWIAGNLLEPAN